MAFNGFALFTKEMRTQLEGYGQFQSQQQTVINPQLIRNVSHWDRLPNEDKKVWRGGGRDKHRSEDNYSYKRQTRPNRRQKDRSATVVGVSLVKRATNGQGRRRNEEIKKLDEFDEDDYPEDAMFGKPINPSDYDDDRMSEQSFSKKYANDKARVLKLLQTLKSIDEVKTYGNFDGICVPAEIAVCEFNLRHGIIDQFNSVVGPWHIDSEIQRRRAEFHARETHKIHVEGSQGKSTRVATQNSCLREILGRCEPLIAEQHGFSVGLYRGGIREFDTDVANFNAINKQMNICGEIKGISAILGGDPNGRRWLVCLRHEYEDIRSSLQFLKQSQGSRYEGFPSMDDQFILADALVDAVAEHLKGTPNAEYKLWMDIFGISQQFEFVTPWERRAKVFCRMHSASRNCCCAAATAARSCFAIFFALREILQLPFGD